jgi:uncharacterized protein YdaU (DUF1376 family)
MKADTWMPFYIADYLRKTMRLTRDQHGGYCLLLMACWDGGGRLPNDPAQLAGIVKASPAEWRKLAPVLLPYFEIDGEWLIHGRVMEERAKAQRLSDARRESGSKGGRPRKQDDSEEKPIGFQNGSQNETPAYVAPPSPLTPPDGGIGGVVGASAPVLVSVSDWPEGNAEAHAKRLVELVGSAHLDLNRSTSLVMTTGRLAAWRRDGASWEHDVVPVVTATMAKRREPVQSWKFFDAAVARSIADNREALTIPDAATRTRATGPPSWSAQVDAATAEARRRLVGGEA